MYQLVQVNNVASPKEHKIAIGNIKLDQILGKYDTVFRDKLPPGLPPKREIDHVIEIADGLRPLIGHFPNHPWQNYWQ